MRAGLHERGRFKYAFARGISGLSLLGSWLAGRGRECDGETQWDRANRCPCVAALPGGRMAALAAIGKRRDRDSSQQLPASPSLWWQQRRAWRCRVYKLWGLLLFIAPRTGLAGPPAAPPQQAPCCPCAGGAAPTSPVPPVASRHFELAAVLSALDGTSTMASRGHPMARVCQVLAGSGRVCRDKFALSSLLALRGSACDLPVCRPELGLLAELDHSSRSSVWQRGSWPISIRRGGWTNRRPKPPRGPQISGNPAGCSASVQPGPGGWLGVVGRIPACSSTICGLGDQRG